MGIGESVSYAPNRTTEWRMRDGAAQLQIPHSCWLNLLIGAGVPVLPPAPLRATDPVSLAPVRATAPWIRAAGTDLERR